MAMPRMSKIVPCVDCQGMLPRKQLNRMGRCHECATEKLRAVFKGLYDKSGPEYEHWKAAMKERIGRL